MTVDDLPLEVRDENPPVKLRHLVIRLNTPFNDGGLLWLGSPSGYLHGELPIAALRTGGVDRVLAALEALESGSFL